MRAFLYGLGPNVKGVDKKGSNVKGVARCRTATARRERGCASRSPALWPDERGVAPAEASYGEGMPLAGGGGGVPV
jgi:hypothetical protein